MRSLGFWNSCSLFHFLSWASTSSRTKLNTTSKLLLKLFLSEICRPWWIRQFKQASELLDAYPNWTEPLNIFWFANYCWMILFTLSQREHYWWLSITTTIIVSVKKEWLDNILTPAVQMFSFWGSLICSSWHLFSQRKHQCFPYSTSKGSIWLFQ